MWLYFDQIHHGTSNDGKFETIKPYLNAFVNGQTACVFNHGTTGSGKTCTMFGTQNSTGIIVRSAEYVLTAGHIKVSVIEVIDKKYYDLNCSVKKILNANESPTPKLINSLADFISFVAKFRKMRCQKSTDQNSTSSRSHLIVKFQYSSHSEADMVFIDLAGWESPRGKENVEETKFINSTLTELNTALLKVSKNMVPTFNTPLLKLLKPYFSGASKTMMLYHVSNTAIKKGLENIKDVVGSNKTEKRPHSTPLSDMINKRIR